MWNFSTLIPIIISVALPIAIYWWTRRDQDRKSMADNVIETRTEMIEGEAKFRSDILEQMRTAQAENAKLRADLWDCQKDRLDLRASADELAKVKEENEVLNRLLKKQQ